MDTEEAQHWLLLHQLLAGNGRALRRLLSLSHDPSHILQADWHRAGIDPTRRPARGSRSWRRAQDAAQRGAETLGALGASLLPLPHPDFPPLLAAIPDPPALLYLRGRRELLARSWLAVVGSRKASEMGRRAARDFSVAAVAAGLGICSGMALGIDGSAHRAALDCGGPTCAVIGTGLDVDYPRRHRALAAEIAREGLVLSECALGSPPLAENFPRRNRIISGLSLGTLVVEAALRSGSLITARMALEQNREVFALPHSPYHVQGRGCNQLLRDGAQLADEPGTVLRELGVLYATQQALSGSSPTAIPANLQDLYARLGWEPCSAGELATAAEQSLSEALSGLAELELLGLVSCRGGRYMRC